jgi:hypothetical protein
MARRKSAADAPRESLDNRLQRIPISFWRRLTHRSPRSLAWSCRFGARSRAARLERWTAALRFEQPSEAHQEDLALQPGDACQNGFGYTWHSISSLQKSEEAVWGLLR